MIQQAEWDDNYGPVVNGKVYPLWGQFVMKKDQWIGGQLTEHDTIIFKDNRTKIKDISITPNGPDSAMFCVHGIDFDFKCDIRHLGIGGPPPTGLGLKLVGAANLSATITQKE